MFWKVFNYLEQFRMRIMKMTLCGQNYPKVPLDLEIKKGPPNFNFNLNLTQSILFHDISIFLFFSIF